MNSRTCGGETTENGWSLIAGHASHASHVRYFDFPLRGRRLDHKLRCCRAGPAGRPAYTRRERLKDSGSPSRRHADDTYCRASLSRPPHATHRKRSITAAVNRPTRGDRETVASAERGKFRRANLERSAAVRTRDNNTRARDMYAAAQWS